MTTNSRKNNQATTDSAADTNAAENAESVDAPVADTLPTDEASVEPASTEMQVPAPAVAPSPASADADAPADTPIADGKVTVKLAHPLDKPDDLRRLGLEEKAGVGDEIRVSSDHARMLINAGYAQTDPEDAAAVAAVLGTSA